MLCLWAIGYGSGNGGLVAAADLSQYAVPFYLRNMANEPVRLYWIGTSYILDQTIPPVQNATTVRGGSGVRGERERGGGGHHPIIRDSKPRANPQPDPSA